MIIDTPSTYIGVTNPAAKAPARTPLANVLASPGFSPPVFPLKNATPGKNKMLNGTSLN